MTPEVQAWCVRQCEMQHATTEADFAGMAKAWQYASDMVGDFDRKVDVADILMMGAMVDREANLNGVERSRLTPLSASTNLPAMLPAWLGR